MFQRKVPRRLVGCIQPPLPRMGRLCILRFLVLRRLVQAVRRQEIHKKGFGTDGLELCTVQVLGMAQVLYTAVQEAHTQEQELCMMEACTHLSHRKGHHKQKLHLKKQSSQLKRKSIGKNAALCQMW